MDAGVCGASASWTAPTVTDNCPGATIAQTAGPSSGSLFPAGVTTVTYTATDAPGNSDVQLHGDGESGHAGAGDRGLPGQHRAGGDGRGCVRSGGELDSADGRATTALERRSRRQPARAAGVCSRRGDDGDLHGDGRGGDTATCSFTVTVSPDAQAPVIAGCPVNIGPVAMDAGCAERWRAGQRRRSLTTALERRSSQTAGPSSGSLFPAGVTTVTYTATDAPGNSDVQLHGDGSPDTQAPVIAGCPANIGPVRWTRVCAERRRAGQRRR